MRDLLFWGLFPFLLPQALYVRQTAPRFAPAVGPREGACGDGDTLRLVAVGDSIIAGVGASVLSKALVGRTAAALASARKCRVSWQALGRSGYDSRKVIDELVPKLPGDAADYFIVSVGVNDITGLTNLDTWQRNLSLLLDKLRAHSPNADIAVAGMPPMHGFPLLPQPLRAVIGMRARSFDAATRAIVDKYPASVHVPLDFEPEQHKFAPDGYHPSEESYVEFGQHMADALLMVRTELR